MNYREVELLAPESIATAGTRTIDLGTNQPVSRVDVIWKKTNTNRTPIAHPGKIVESIDIVDGSDVLFSLDGMLAQAWAWFHGKNQPGSMINYETGQWSMQMASIYFGRYLWDELYALDPKRHNNVQIKVKHNLANGGATGTVADLSVYAHVFDEKSVTPKGFVLTKEQYSFLPVANAWVYIDMPMDYPIRALSFGAPECEDGPEYNLDEFVVSENGGKNIIVKSAMERYLLVQSANLEPWTEKVLFRTAAAATDLNVYITPHWERRFTGCVEGAGLAIGVRSDAGCLTKVQNASAAALIEGHVHGFAPFGQVYIPFAQSVTEEGWLPQAKGNARLDIQAGATPDTDEYVKVAVQQLRSY